MSRILIISDAGDKQINGVVTTLTQTISILRDRGHHVSLIEPGLFNKTHPLPFYKEIRVPFPPYGLEPLIESHDAIHISTESALGLSGRKSCLKIGKKFTTAYHTQFPEYLKKHLGMPEWVGYRYMKWFHGKSSAVMVPTKSMMDTLSKKGFRNVVHWGRGVDKALFHPRPKTGSAPWGEGLQKPYWLNVGRVSHEKNLEAFLSLDLPGTKIIVGDGPALESLREKFPKAVFMGALKGENLAQCYNHSTVFVFPSLTDTYGLVIAEAISSGCPVAAYPVTGPIDIVERGLTGVLDDNLRNACLHALYLVGNGSIVERDFSWDIATDQFYENLCFNN